MTKGSLHFPEVPLELVIMENLLNHTPDPKQLRKEYLIIDCRELEESWKMYSVF